MTVLEKDKEANAQSTTVECLSHCERLCIVDHGSLKFGARFDIFQIFFFEITKKLNKIII